jgi:hypothetical protein
MFDLLHSTNGGVVAYRMFDAVVWDGVPPRGDMIDAYIRQIRFATGLGITHHKGVGYQLDPSRDGVKMRVSHGWVYDDPPPVVGELTEERVLEFA